MPPTSARARRAAVPRLRPVPLACLLAGALLLGPTAATQAANARAHAAPPHAAEPACPEGTRPGPGRACFPERDLRGARLGAEPRGLPNLARQRRDRRFREGLAPIEAPVPGGIGIGTLFKDGALPVTELAELETTVFVHPDGIEPSTSNLDWLFSTSTNRTQAGVEFVAGYQGANPGWLGVFDWSCSASDPCEGGQTGPAWIWTFDLTSRPEYLFAVYDDGGHLQDAIRYVNRSERLPGGPAPHWRNQLLLWNEADQLWDLVYEHAYEGAQPDCSVTGCAWWGPILEDFRVDPALPLPEIRELGFQDTELRHDGAVSALGPAETDWVPPAAPWRVAHHVANGAYGAGNVFGDAAACADGVDNDGDGLVDLADPGCAEAGDDSENGPAVARTSCGIGAELVLALPLFGAARARRTARSAR